MYYPVERRIAAATVLRRERLLPVEGDVLVAPGDLVEPSDVVARCRLPGTLHVVDVRRCLATDEDRAQGAICRTVGDVVEAGEVLAELGRLPLAPKRTCCAPVNGMVVSLQDGLILLEAESTGFELSAHLRGRVESVLPGRGAVVSATGAQVQGVWGCGGESVGTLRVLVDHPQKLLLARSIVPACRGALVAGGQLVGEYVLEHAVKGGAGGLIVGGVAPELLSLLPELPFPVMSTEGFGPWPMSREVFSLLQAQEGREAMMSGGAMEGRPGLWPEVLIPTDGAGDATADEADAMPLRVGAKVRCLRAPHHGEMGLVITLPALPVLQGSGLRLHVAEVELEASGRTVVVPLSNLEMIR